MKMDLLFAKNIKTKRSKHTSFYVSFSDLMVLLVVFFVMILSMSKIETGSFEKIKTAFTGKTKDTLMELALKLEKIATIDPGIPGVSANMASDGVRIDMDTNMLFDLGSALIKKDFLAPLNPLLTEIMNTGYMVDIEGHTDDIPLFKRNNQEIETNWSLSGRRASSVVHYLIDYGFNPGRLRIVGHADTKPKIKIKGKIGKELQMARAQNRRVTLLIR